MPWDRGYYYRAVRRGGKPTREYIGGGRLGELAARQDAIEREARAAAADGRRARAAADRAADGETDAQYRRLRTWTAALLAAAGWYQHKRGWRRMDLKAFAKRYREAEERDAARAAGKLTSGGDSLQLTAGPTGEGQPQDRTELEAGAAELEALVKRVNGPRPSRADLDALRAALTAQDGGNGIITVLDGNTTLGAILDAYTDSAASKMVMRADADRLALTLGRAGAPPFERPLIDHIVTCWVRLQLVERDHAAATRGEHSRESGAYWDRRLASAQRRYLRALHLLAKLRHMGPLQVNIANQQVVMNGRNE